MALADEITGLLDSTLGDDVVSGDEIRTYLGSDSAVVLALEALDGDDPEITRITASNGPQGRVVGVSIARAFATASDLSDHPYFHSSPEELLGRIDLTDDEFPVGSVFASGIADGYQGEGHGPEISFAAADALLSDGVAPIVQFEWDRPDSPGIETLKEAGFEPRTRYEDHFPSGWNCGACGADGCSCDVVVFRLWG